MTPTKKQPEIPPVVRCAGCHRNLERANYAALPMRDTLEPQITRLAGGRYPYGVHCSTCDHYTVWEPHRP